MLTKSKYCKGVQCPKILWLDENKPDEACAVADDSILETGRQVGILAREYYSGCAVVEYNTDLAAMVQKTAELITKGASVIAEASFVYDECFCAVDLLKIVSSEADEIHVNIIEVKSATEVHDIFMHDMAFQYYVLSHCGIKVNAVFNMHINNKYVRRGELNLQELFVLEDCTEQVLALQMDMEAKVAEYKAAASVEDEPVKEIDLCCEEPYECVYKKFCGQSLPKHNVFNIHGLRNKKKYELYHNGIISFADIADKQPKISEKQMRQVLTTLNHMPPIINKEEIRAFLDTLTYPLYFLDFETFQQAIPQFDGVSPYMQLPFQYSLHVITNEGGQLEHYEFLGKEGTDPRRALAQQLCSQIPEGVCTLAYNMGFEKGVLKRLAEMYSDLKEHLMNIHDNIKDLMVPFQKQYYYCEALQGSYSIKWVLPALCPGDSELDYHALEGVHNGSEAMTAFAELPGHTENEIETIRKNLLAYCRLDTLAMVKIWERLWQIVED